jgi:co-chaperonin GroES (HSP10)
MIQSPVNNVIVKVKTKYIGNISKILQLSAIQNGSSVDSVDLVNIMGEIVSLPRTVSDYIGYKGFSTKDMQVGDTAIFSYSIIHDFVIPEEDADPIYRNRMMYKGEEYFLADITKIFGVIRDGEIIMVNGYVMSSEFSDSNFVLPASLKKIKKAAETNVMHIGYPKKEESNIDIQSGDKIYFNSMTAQKYQINQKPFSIIQQNKIFGKEVLD